MRRPRLRGVKPTHYVDYFCSFRMRNATEPCVFLDGTLHDDANIEDVATVEIYSPVRKRIRVPLNCLVDIRTGQRLPFDTGELE